MNETEKCKRLCDLGHAASFSEARRKIRMLPPAKLASLLDAAVNDTNANAQNESMKTLKNTEATLIRIAGKIAADWTNGNRLDAIAALTVCLPSNAAYLTAVVLRFMPDEDAKILRKMLLEAALTEMGPTLPTE